VSLPVNRADEVINQIDTTGSHINGTKEKSGDFTREELSAILKFGAQNMFKSEDSVQSKKLDEMDLDEILNKADAFDTEAAAQGTSLGGQDFLASFADIQDVKHDDLAWDDIIPAEDRVVEEAEAVVINRKRAARPTYDDGTESQPGSPEKKRPKPAPRKSINKSSTERTLELKGKS
jgi:chromodomain-helicase-DNA-binding protein 1